MNNTALTATGDWDTTTLYNNGDEVSALEFYIEIEAGQDDGYGNVLADASQTLFGHQSTLCAVFNLTANTNSSASAGAAA